MVVFALWRQGAVRTPSTGVFLESVVVLMGSEKFLLCQGFSLLMVPTPVEYLKGKLNVSYGRVPVDVQQVGDEEINTHGDGLLWQCCY